MKHKNKQLLSILLSLVLMLGMLPDMSLTAYADGATWNESFTTVGGTISGGVTVSDDITLTIPAGKKLTVEDGINANGHTLTVSGEGELVVNGAWGGLSSEIGEPGKPGGIGFTGILVVDGATVIIKGGDGGVGNRPAPVYNGIYIGCRGGEGGTGVKGNITVNSGSATVTGGEGGDGGRCGDGGKGGTGVEGTVTVTVGSATVTGGDGGSGGSSLDNTSAGSGGASGVAVTGTISGTTVEESSDNSAWSAISGSASTMRYVRVTAPVITKYPLWIGGVQANENNCNKLSDNHWSYDSSTHTLTLSGYTYQGQGYVFKDGGEGAAIYYNGEDALAVVLIGENHITPAGTNLSDCGIVSDNTGGALTFSGSGSLLIDSVGNFKYYNSAIYSRESVIFTSGSFKLGNNDADYGVRVDNGSYVVIEDGVSSFEAKGYYAAINGKVRNAVAGTGYDLYQTRAGRLNTSTDGAALTYTSGLQTNNYQKATFPVGQYTVVFNPGDGSGNMDPLTISEGEKLKLPKCTLTPPKDDNGNDKVFNWWEVSGADGIYFVDSEVLIANNCAWDNVVTVTAKWKAKTGASILVDAEGQELDYTGDAQALLSQDGVAFGGTMSYAFGEDDVTAPKEGWDTALPQQTDAGTYYVWYKAAGNEEYFDSEAKCTTAKINQAAAQTIEDVETELVYTVTSVSVSVAGKMPDDAGTLTYAAGDASKTGNVTVSNFTVGTDGNVSATLSGGAAGDSVTLPVNISSTNYADSTVNVVITLTVKGDAGVTISGAPTQAKTYGDADFTLTGNVTDPGTGTGTWTWSTSDDTVFQITPDGATTTVKILKAGSATVAAKYESDTTVDTEIIDTITVNTKTLTIQAKDQSIYVDGTVPSLSGADFYTVTGLVGEDVLTTSPTLAYQKDGNAVTPDNTIAGTYDIVPSGASAGDNYSISYTNGTLTINKKQVVPETAVEKVSREIRSLPTPVTMEDRKAVEQAKKDYDALTQTQQESISKDLVEKLGDAVDTIAALTFEEKVNALPDPLALDDKGAVDKATESYDGLTDSQKSKVSEEAVGKLGEAIDRIAALTVEEEIKALPEKVTLDDEEAVNKIKEAYDALTENQKTFVSADALQKLTQAGETIETIKQEKANEEAFEQEIAGAKTLKTKLLKVKNKAGGKVVVKWKKAVAVTANTAAISGYQIRCSLKKNFKKKTKTKKVAKASTSKTTIKKLKIGRTYYIQVRPYTKVTNQATGESKTIAGKWSNKKKVKIRK